ncbi:MAG: IPT/TIG domain-containing protein [Gammaproteobacteria bacterium]
MYKQIIPTLLVTLGLASWADTGFAVSIHRAARPVIASTTVDADKNIMVVSGEHFGRGSPVVAVGDRVLRVQSHSDNEVVVEIPAGLAPGSYRLIVTTAGPDKQSSEPFSSALFAAR